MDPQPTTRERLIAAATSLFADRGFRGADVRSICNIARVNPGAVSYHFGGKGQLYRAVLRAVVDRLAGAVAKSRSAEESPSLIDGVAVLYRRARCKPSRRPSPTARPRGWRSPGDRGVGPGPALCPRQDRRCHGIHGRSGSPPRGQSNRARDRSAFVAGCVGLAGSRTVVADGRRRPECPDDQSD